MRPAEQRAADVVKRLRGLSHSTNMLATELEVLAKSTQLAAEQMERFARVCDANADRLIEAASELRGEAP